MLYHSKHAPSRARTTLVRRTVGAGIAAAAGLGVGVATASTASADVWDDVAQCESGGNWSISTGNGFSGGLQFTPSTWRANGGTGSPAAASAAQQKAVAQRVLASQGPGAWPVCSKKAGLTSGNGGATSAPVAASRSAARTAPVQAAAPKTTTKSTTTKTTAKSTTKAVAPKATVRKTTVRKSTAPSRVATSGKTYTVKSGDTLSKLAASWGVGDWHKLWSANSTIKNPNLIYVGQVLNLLA